MEGQLRATDYPTNGRGSDRICFFDCFHDLGDALGAEKHTRDALAGERTLREVMMAAGFQGLRRAAETPFNLVLEARP